MSPSTCPNCGEPIRPEQDWCLNCGTALNTRIAGTPNWRAPLAIVATVLTLVAAGVVVAFLELSDDSDKSTATATTVAQAKPTPTPKPTSTPDASITGPTGPTGEDSGSTGPTGPTGEDEGPTGPTGSATPTSSSTPDSSSTPSSTSTPSSSSTPSATTTPDTSSTPEPSSTPDNSSSGSGDVASWPSGKAAWTVVLESATSESAANKKAKSLAGDVSDVGVLHSDDYSSLKKGYWVVFSGQFSSQKQAQAHASELATKAPGAYARYVKE